MLQTASMLGDLGGGEVGRSPIPGPRLESFRPDKPTPHITGHIKSQDDTTLKMQAFSFKRKSPKPMRKRQLTDKGASFRLPSGFLFATRQGNSISEC